MDGRITLSATIGQVKHQDAFAFRVFGQDQPARGEIAVVDPEGLTSKMLANLGYSTRSWNGQAADLVVIGRNGLKANPALSARLEAYVQAGGRALVCGQDPQWLSQSLGWRICPHVSRRVFPMNLPLTGGIDAEDLRDWTGSSSLVEAYPEYLANTPAGGPPARRPAVGEPGGDLPGGQPVVPSSGGRQRLADPRSTGTPSLGPEAVRECQTPGSRSPATLSSRLHQ